MADYQSNININVDTTNAIAAIRNLQGQISAFHQQMRSSGSAANAAASSNMQRNLQNSINSTGKFAANLTSVKTETEAFTGALEKNKLSMGQYFRFAGASSRTFGRLFKGEFNTISKVAEARVKTLQTQYVKLGRDASGSMRAMSVKPLSLDMKNLSNQTMIAAQKQQIFNQLLRQGSTNLLNFGKNTQWAGRQLMVGFTIPLSILGMTAVKEFQKIEEQMIRLKRVYGDLFTTDAEVEKAVEDIKQLADEFTRYGIAVEETIGLAASVAQMGGMGADLTNQVTQATRLAVLGGMEQQKALDTTISLTNAFGIATEDLSEKINFLNAAENQTILAIDDFTEAVPKAGSVVAQLGGSVEDLAFFLTAMREGGINASQGANALKSSLARLISPTEVAQKKLGAMGIDILSIVDTNAGNLKETILELAYALETLEPLERSRALEQLFGKFQFARMSTLFQNVIKEGSQAQSVLELTNRTSAELRLLAERELKRVEESPATKLQKQIEQLQKTLAPIGAEFIKLILPIAEFFTDLLKKFNNLSDGAKSFVTGLVAVLGLIAPVALMSFGLIANGIANIIKGFSMYRSFLSLLSGVNTSVATSTQYMTQEQLEATSVATNLGQAHSYLAQQFNVETAALTSLTNAYGRAITQQNLYRAATMSTPSRIANPSVQRSQSGRRATSPGGTLPGYKDGIRSIPGRKGAGDIHPAMLAPGEAVIPADKAQKYSGFISAIFNDSIPGFFRGFNPFTRMFSKFGKASTQSGRVGHQDVYGEMRNPRSFKRFMKQKPKVAVRMHSDDLFNALGSGETRYKSLFETGTSRGSLDTMDKRALAEQNLFGLSPNVDPSQRPVYGYAFSKERNIGLRNPADGANKTFMQRLFSEKSNPSLKSQALSQNNYGTGNLLNDRTFRYGDLALIPDMKKIRKRTTITYGDSYNQSMDQYAKPLPISQAGRASTARHQQAMTSRDKDFYEAQIMGGFDFKDIKRIVTTEPKMIPMLEDRLRQAGYNIPIGLPRYSLLDKIKRIANPGSMTSEMALPKMDRFGKYKVPMDKLGRTLRESPMEGNFMQRLMANAKGYANGVFQVPGVKGAGDVVPAMLSPGEAVIPAKQTVKYASLVRGMISDSIPGFENGKEGLFGKYESEMAGPRGRRGAGKSIQNLNIASPGAGNELANMLAASKASLTEARKILSQAVDEAGRGLSELTAYINNVKEVIDSKDFKSGPGLTQAVRDKTGYDPKNQGRSLAHIGSGIQMSKEETLASGMSLSPSKRSQIESLPSSASVDIKSGLGMGNFDTEVNRQLAQEGASIEKFSGAFDEAGVEKWNDSVSFGGGSIEELAQQASRLDQEFRGLIASVDAGSKVFDSEAQRAQYQAKTGQKAVSVESMYGQARSRVKGQASSLISTLDKAQTIPTEARVLGQSPGNKGRRPLLKSPLPALAVQAKKEQGLGTLGKASVSPQKDAASDGNVYSKTFNETVEKRSQDPYMLARDKRNSPHPQSGKDGADDASAYSKGLNSKPPTPPGQKPVRRAASGPISPGGVPTPPGRVSSPLNQPEAALENRKSVKGFAASFGSKFKESGQKLGKQAMDAVEKSSIGRNLGTRLAASAGNTLVDSRGNTIYDADTGTQYGNNGQAIATGLDPLAPGKPGAAGSIESNAARDSDGNPVLDQKGNIVTKKEMAKASKRQISMAKKQKRGMVAGRVAGIGMSASMMLGMTSMMPGVADNPIMQKVQGLMPAMMGLSVVAPMLAALPGPIVLVIAALGALGFGLYQYNKSIEESRKSGIDLGNALSTSTDKLIEMSKVAGSVSSTEVRRASQEDQISGTTDFQRTSGMNFMDSTAGASILEDISSISKAGLGMEEASEAMARQLSLAVFQGVLKPEQANSIIAAIGSEMNDYQFSAGIQGTLISLIGPNGADITKEPLEVALAIQDAGVKQIDNFGAMIQERLGKDFNLFDNMMQSSDVRNQFDEMDSVLQDEIRFRAQLEEQYGNEGIGKLFAGAQGFLLDNAIFGKDIYKEAKDFIDKSSSMADSTKLQSAGIQLGINQVAENQQILDAMEAQYSQKIQSLEADIEAEKNAKKRKQLEQDLINLEKERATAVKTLNSENAGVLDKIVEMRDIYADTKAFDKAIEKSVLGRFDDDDPMKVFAEETINALKILEDSDFKTNIQLGFASGELSVSNIQTLLNASEEDLRVPFRFEILTDEQGFGNASQLLTLLGNAGVGEDGLAMGLKLFLNIESPEDFENKLQALAEISQLEQEYGVKVSLEGDSLETKINAITGAMDTLKDNPEIVSKATLETEGGPEFEAILANWQTLVGEVDTISKTAIFEFIAMFKTSSFDDDLVDRYVQEVGGFTKRLDDLTSKEIQAEATAFFQAKEKKRKLDDPDGEELEELEDTGPASSALDSIVSKLKEVRDETIKTTKGWTASIKQLQSLFGGNKTLTIFDGLRQSLRKLGAGENLIELIAGMNPDEFEERKNDLFTIKDGQIIKLKDQAISIGNALNSIKIGEFQNEQERSLVQLSNQESAFKLLREAGLGVAEAYAAIADEALAAAIASGELTDKEIDALISKMKEVREASEISDAFENARKAIQEFNEDLKIRADINAYINSSDFDSIQGNIIGGQVDGALAAAAILKDESLKALVAAGRAGSEEFSTRLSQLMSSEEFLQGIFDRGYSNVQEAFSVQEAKIRNDFEDRLLEGTLAGYDFDNMFGLEELSSMVGMSQEEIKDLFSLKDPEGVIEQAKAQISTLNYEVNELNSEIDKIQEKEDEINKKYDERLDALDDIKSINEENNKLQQSQLSIADALTRGDIAAAAKAAQESRQQQAQARIEDREKQLEIRRESELEEVRSESGKTRLEIEEAIKDIKKEISEIEENSLEPATRLLELSDLLLSKQMTYNTVLGKTREEWGDIKLEVDLAKIQSDKFVDSIKAALSAVQALIDAYRNLNQEMKKEPKEEGPIPDKFLDTPIRSMTVDPETGELVEDTNIKTIGDLPKEEQEFLYDWLEENGDQSGSSSGSSSNSTSTSSGSSVYQAQGVSVENRDKAAAAAIGAVKSGQASDPLDFANSVRDTILANRNAVRSGDLSSSEKQKAMQENINLMKDTGLKFSVGGPVNYLAGGGLPSNSVGKGKIGYFPMGGQIPYKRMGGMIPYKRMGGMIPYKASGGLFQSVNTDTVPAMLTPGEFVVRRSAVESFGTDNLKSINNGTYSGDSVYNYSLNVNVKSEANPDEIARSVMTQIKQIDSQRLRGNRF